VGAGAAGLGADGLERLPVLVALCLPVLADALAVRLDQIGRQGPIRRIAVAMEAPARFLAPDAVERAAGNAVLPADLLDERDRFGVARTDGRRRCRGLVRSLCRGGGRHELAKRRTGLLEAGDLIPRLGAPV